MIDPRVPSERSRRRREIAERWDKNQRTAHDHQEIAFLDYIEELEYNQQRMQELIKEIEQFM